MKEDPKYRHLAKRYMTKSRGDDDDSGNGIGDMKVVTQSPTTHNTDQVKRGSKCANADVTTEEYIGMCSNMKKGHCTNSREDTTRKEQYKDTNGEQSGITD